MVITIASFKGGVGKTTTALHLAHLLHQKDPTMLVDTDPNKSAMNWARRRQQKGQESPFNVGPATTLAKVSRDYNHFVVDTPARPENLDLESLLDGSDVLLIPTQPASMALDTLQEAYEAFQKIASPAIWVLLTSVPPAPQRDAREAREVLTDLGFRVLDAQIRRSKAFEYAARRGWLSKTCQSNSESTRCRRREAIHCRAAKSGDIFFVTCDCARPSRGRGVTRAKTFRKASQRKIHNCNCTCLARRDESSVGKATHTWG